MWRELLRVSPADHFSALGLPRRAELDPEEVRAAFQERSRTLHPDAGGDPEAFEAANRAAAVLAEPASRLRHLAELEFGAPPDPAGAVDAATMALFEPTASVLAEADALIARREAATSAVGRALLERGAAELAGPLLAAGGAVRGRRGEALARLAEVDAALASGGRERARELIGELARALAFLGKWEAQIAARVAALAG